MSRGEETIARRLDGWRRQGRRVVWLFDYDGTLTPIRPRPEEAVLPPATRRVLYELSRRPGQAAGVISGRMLDDVCQLVDLPGLYYAGTTGLELDLRGVRLTHPDAARGQALVALVTPLLQQAAAECAGAWVEAKRLGLTLHYRAAPQPAHAPLRARALDLLRPWAGQLRVLAGPCAIEVTARLGWTKGTALGMMVEDAGTDAVPVYAGDGPNDVDAVEAAHRLGGLTLGIGAEAPAAAQHRLPNPAALWRLLAGWLAASAERRRPAAQFR
ncbi:MAG: trehalose-phosphatase [Planctomycetia bacterium]|nr:trehalose-phosphatase [Planctomycetia bacterium]